MPKIVKCLMAAASKIVSVSLCMTLPGLEAVLPREMLKRMKGKD